MAPVVVPAIEASSACSARTAPNLLSPRTFMHPDVDP